MSILFGIVGLIFIYLIGLAVSSDRKKIRYKQIIILLLQFVIAFLFLNTDGGVSILTNISGFFSWLMNQASGGVNFVFGGIQLQKGVTSIFFLNVLMPIVFISALVGILNYIKILPFIIKWLGFLINKISGMGELENYFAVSTAVLGQPEVFLTIKEKIPYLSPNVLYKIFASAMSAVSAAMLASYMKMVPGKYVVVAVFLNIFSALIISSIVNPYEPQDVASLDKITEEMGDEDQPSFFQMLGTYILDGFNLAITVAAMLIGFVALITFLNSSFEFMFHVSFTNIIGWIFAPVALIIGVPQNDMVKVGSLMATKLITNEFVAMGELHNIAKTLSPKALAMISTYLVSFANLGTLGIITGSIISISKKQGAIISRLTLKLLLGATLASLLTATIVGVFF